MLQQIPISTKRCTANIEIRDLERSITQVTPNEILMEGNTVLTQYIITFWKLDYIDKGIHMIVYKTYF
jgi:hypothetical protein